MVQQLNCRQTPTDGAGIPARRTDAKRDHRAIGLQLPTVLEGQSRSLGLVARRRRRAGPTGADPPSCARLPPAFDQAGEARLGQLCCWPAWVGSSQRQPESPRPTRRCTAPTASARRVGSVSNANDITAALICSPRSLTSWHRPCPRVAHPLDRTHAARGSRPGRRTVADTRRAARSRSSHRETYSPKSSHAVTPTPISAIASSRWHCSRRSWSPRC